MQNVYTIPEIAEMFGVSTNTVRAWIYKGKLTPISSVIPGSYQRHTVAEEELLRFSNSWEKKSKTNTGAKRTTVMPPMIEEEPEETKDTYSPQVDLKNTLKLLADLSNQLVKTQATINTLLTLFSETL